MSAGKAIQVYVPEDEHWVIEEIRRLVRVEQTEGIRGSFSSKAVAVWRLGLEKLREVQGTPAGGALKGGA